MVHAVTETVGTAASKAKAPIMAGGAAAAGAARWLGARCPRAQAAQDGPRRPDRPRGLDLKPVVKEVQKAGMQIGRLTDEMAQARKHAKKVGDALS